MHTSSQYNTLFRSPTYILLIALLPNYVQATTTPPHQETDGPWAIELGVGVGISPDDAYTEALTAAGYNEQSDTVQIRGSVTIVHALSSHLTLGSYFMNLDNQVFSMQTATSQSLIDWKSYGLGINLRTGANFLNDILAIYGQLGVGPTVENTTREAKNNDTNERTQHSQWTYNVMGSIGLIIMPKANLGLYLQTTYVYAPSTVKQDGQEFIHNAGSINSLIGLRALL